MSKTYWYKSYNTKQHYNEQNQSIIHITSTSFNGLKTPTEKCDRNLYNAVQPVRIDTY